MKAEIVLETSAKDDAGINELFEKVAYQLIKKQKSKQVRSSQFIKIIYIGSGSNYCSITCRGSRSGASIHEAHTIEIR